MKKSSRIVSANLSELAIIIYSKLNKHKSKGWFSQWVSEQLVKCYYKDLKKTILTEMLIKKQKERDKLDSEVVSIAKKLRNTKGD